MAKRKKGDRIQVILECTEQRKTDVPGISRYYTYKNRKSEGSKDRMTLKKYNPYLKKHTVHKEIK